MSILRAQIRLAVAEARCEALLGCRLPAEERSVVEQVIEEIREASSALAESEKEASVG